METFSKVTSGNHLPLTGDDRFPVYSKQFNDLVDTLNEIFTEEGNLSIDTITTDSISNDAETMFAAFYPTTVQNNITAGTGGAISLTNYLTTINTDAGGDAFTLADSTQGGQMKKILLVADGGGDATITLTGYTSIVMNDATDYVILMWNGSAWKVLENSGCTVNA